jgi:hypothetical protein
MGAGELERANCPANCPAAEARVTKAPGIAEGSTLHVPQPYFLASHDCLFEIGVKLAHVLWRKLFPENREAADQELAVLSFELLVVKAQ